MTGVRHSAAAFAAMLAPAGLGAFEGRQPEFICEVPPGCIDSLITYDGQCRIAATDGEAPFDPFSDQDS